MPILDNKNKTKEKTELELNTIHEESEPTDMEIEGMVPPLPDNYASFGNGNPNGGQNIGPLAAPLEIPLNEEALKDLIKKE